MIFDSNKMFTELKLRPRPYNSLPWENLEGRKNPSWQKVSFSRKGTSFAVGSDESSRWEGSELLVGREQAFRWRGSFPVSNRGWREFHFHTILVAFGHNVIVDFNMTKKKLACFTRCADIASEIGGKFCADYREQKCL